MSLDALAGSLTFSDPISGADDIPPEPVPGESGEKAARQPRRGQKRPAAKVSRPPAAAGGKRPANTTPTFREVRDELMAHLELAAFAGTLRCGECAAVLHEQAGPIADACARYAVRSPIFLKILRQSVELKNAVELLRAVRPVYEQIRTHHFIPPPETAAQGEGPDGPYDIAGTAAGNGAFRRFAPYSG